MPVKDVTDESEFRSLISGSKVVFVDFFATWCGPCRAIGPVFEQYSSKYANRGTFIRVDGDQARGILSQVGVRAFPTFHAYSNGQKLGELVGAQQAQLEQFILQHGKVDMGVGYTLGSGPAPSAAATSPARPAAPQGDVTMEDDPELQAAIAMSLQEDQAMPDAPATAKPGVVCEGDSCRIVKKEEDAAAPPSAPAASKAKLPPVNENFLAQMKEMGVSEVRAYKGLLFTQNASVQHALNWIMEHENDPDIDEELMVVDGPEGGAASAAPVSNLTPEEAKAKAAELVRKAREKREREEKQAELEREKMMRHSGKEMTEIKRKIQEKELEDIQKQKREEKRKEMEEKKRMRALLEADKLQRKVDRLNRERDAAGKPPLTLAEIDELKAASSSAAAPASSAKTAAAAAPVAATPNPRPASAPVATQCVLQIRLSDGSSITEVFKPSTTVREVYDFVSAKRTDGDFAFQLMSPFPRKVYGEDQMDNTMSQEGLVPRSVLQLTKC